MTVEQLERIVVGLQREVKQLKKLNKLQDEEYLTPAQVRQIYGYSSRTLQRYRTSGLLTDYRMSVKGRGYEYSQHQLEKLFRAKVKVA
jgi:hypothetical protein